jgi:predicted Ser/Thr protein kinase
MSPEKFQILMELFQQALALEGGERRRLIDERCGDDSELRHELEALLGEPTEGQPQLVTAGGLEAVRRNVNPERESPGRWTPPAPVLSGNYRLLRVLGEGGMGIVYQAEQAFPRRVVALKAMRSGFVSRSLLRRFQNEAQILARLQHPGIAQIYEAGAADEENPDQAFFAMEFVDGRPLTDFANDRRLTVEQRLELMIRVCDAIQHAHQRGVIHRDLKPSNILVDTTAEPPQPKILDFGVARATDSDLRGTTLQTGVGQLLGTLPYMSPEQIAADPDAIDTRTDVYALGVVLYQLLTGRLPFDVSSRSLADAARMIRDETPSRLSTMDRNLRGDLDTIVAKAIEKDKTRRYQSAAELGDDLRRYLANEPIAAKRDSLGYMLNKRVRRYRWAVVAAGVFLIVMAGFLVHAILQARELAVRLSIANVERGRALAEGGSHTTAGDVLWREFLQHPSSLRTRWALREYYERHPVVRTLSGSEVQPSEVATSPDGQLVAVCGIRGRAGIYRVDLSETLWEAKIAETSAT